MQPFAPHNSPLTELAWFGCDFLDVDTFAKAGAAATGSGRFSGIASTDMVDLDGHVVEQDGIDWSAFEKAGCPLTYEHPRRPDNDIGEATAIQRIELDGFKATQIDGLIYTHHPYGNLAYTQATAMAKSGGKRRMGLSIEGYATKRDGNRIVKSVVTSIAISPAPKNNLTWLDPILASRNFLGLSAPFGTPPYAFAMSAAAVGYPTQGQPSTGEFAPLVGQSIQGKPSTAAAEPSGRDALVLRFLKKNPGMTWAQACEHIDAVRKAA
jgi:hypothetical protein